MAIDSRSEREALAEVIAALQTELHAMDLRVQIQDISRDAAQVNDGENVR